MKIEHIKNSGFFGDQSYSLYTDFPITQKMISMALDVPGVHAATAEHKYLANVFVGRMFDGQLVFQSVIAAISAEALKTSQEEVDDNAFVGGLPAIFPEEGPVLQEVDDNAIFASPAALPEERSALQEVDDNTFIDSPLSGQQVEGGEVDWQARVW